MALLRDINLARMPFNYVIIISSNYSNLNTSLDVLASFLFVNWVISKSILFK